jgi:hypothetical protein
VKMTPRILGSRSQSSIAADRAFQRSKFIEFTGSFTREITANVPQDLIYMMGYFII